MSERFQQARVMVAGAPDHAAVGRALQAGLSQLLPSELLMLPEGVAGLLASEAALVADAALELTQLELRYVGPPEIEALLREITLLYVAAAHRMAAIDAKARSLRAE